MARPILETLNHLNNGTLMMDASEAMSELVQAVGETGKAGKITIEISIRKATAGAMALTGKVSVKKPAQINFESLMFATPEGNLLTEDPRQAKLNLTPVSGGEPLSLQKVGN